MHNVSDHYRVRILHNILIVDGAPSAAHIDHDRREILVQTEPQAAAIYADRLARGDITPEQHAALVRTHNREKAERLADRQ